MLSFPNITPAVFARVLDELRKHSTVTEPSPRIYAIEGSGIDAVTYIDDDGSTLRVDIVHKPWYVSEGMIGGKIRDAITIAQRELEQGDKA